MFTNVSHRIVAALNHMKSPIFDLVASAGLAGRRETCVVQAAIDNPSHRTRPYGRFPACNCMTDVRSQKLHPSRT